MTLMEVIETKMNSVSNIVYLFLYYNIKLQAHKKLTKQSFFKKDDMKKSIR